MKETISLESVLNYQNQDVIEGFMQSLDVTEEDAQNVFRETMRWFWYCNHSDTHGFRSIDANLVIIDEMWHTFILYTKEYVEFCNRFFSRYIHHAPTTNREKEEMTKLSKEERADIKKKQLELVYDLLGRETFIKWYIEFPEKFNRAKIKELRKK